jgi:hypothetical protein
MMKNMLGIFIVSLSMLTLTPTIIAQEDATTINYGDTVEGQITTDAFEVKYRFEGKQNEVVILRMDAEPRDTGLQTPAFKVLSNQTSIIDSTRIFTLSLTVAYAVFQLPRDGEYIIVATRREGKTSQDTGGYKMSLNNALPLTANIPISDNASDTLEKFYVVDSTEPFTIAYSRVSGNFRPAVYVSAIKAAGATEPSAEISGMSLDSGTISVTPQRGTRYLVRVGLAFLSNSKGTTEYNLLFCPGVCVPV